MAKQFTRKGLHRLECPICGGFGYYTVATLEQRGLPSCGWCGETMQPDELELAMILDAKDAPVMRDYEERTARKLLAQKPAQIRASRQGRDPSTLNDMDAKARDEVVAERQSFALWRQVSALRPVTVEAMPF